MKPVLKELCLEITNSCTMECRHCSTRSLRVGCGKPDHIPIFMVQIIVNQFTEMGGEVLEISGGEPLLHPMLFDICRLASESGLEVRLYTSGVRGDEKNGLRGITQEFARSLKDLGVDRIIFNLEGAKPKTHERIMGVLGTHSLVLEGIKNAKAAGLWVGVHFVPMRPNVAELPEVAAICEKLGVDELALLRFVPQGRGEDNKTNLELDNREFQALLKTVVELMERHEDLNIRVGCPMDFLSLLDRNINPHKCKAGITTCSIAPNGDVVPCPGFKNEDGFVAGNIYKNSLGEIWNEGFASLRAFSASSLSGPCNSCSDLDICEGRCAAQRVISTGDLLAGPDPGCPKYLREKRKKVVAQGE